MPTATVTSKGQITIPIEVREAMRIRTGTRIQFSPRADGVWEFLPVTGSVMDLKGMIPWDGPPVSLEQIDEAIAASAVESMNS
jgi:AbrB family looped-hinge helix DNA binding protein